MRIKISLIVLLLSASFAAYNFGLAGGFLEHNRFSFGGLFLGITVNLVIAIASSAYGGVKGKNRRKLATVGLTALMTISPILLSSVFVKLLGDDFYNPVYRWFWAILWASAPDLSMLLAGASGGTKGVISLDSEIVIPTVWFTRLVSKVDRQDVKHAKAHTKVDSKKNKVVTFTDDALIKYIKKHPEKTQEEIGAHFGRSRYTINKRIGKLKQLGKLPKVK